MFLQATLSRAKTVAATLYVRWVAYLSCDDVFAITAERKARDGFLRHVENVTLSRLLRVAEHDHAPATKNSEMRAFTRARPTKEVACRLYRCQMLQ